MDLRLLTEIVVVCLLAGAAFYIHFRAGKLVEVVERQSLERIRLAEDKARAEQQHALLEAREQVWRERELNEENHRRQVEKLERDADALEERRRGLDERVASLRARVDLADRRETELAAAEERAAAELSRIANLQPDEARQERLSMAEAQLRSDLAQEMAEVEKDYRRDAERLAKRTIVDAMERLASEFVSQATLAVVSLPNEEMKGRLIGREGRNIRAFEQVTGTDLIIDDTPEAVVISSFDPVRRETARLTLMNLMLDGRIHPAKIEELHASASIEVHRMLTEAGERAASAARIPGLPLSVLEVMGRLRLRTSMAQNVLDHSVETAHLCRTLAAELGYDAELAATAGFLHDIGKGLSTEREGPHAIVGMEFLRENEFTGPILNAVGAHHREIPPETAEAQLVIIADAISASRPGARRESLELYVQRLSSLEALVEEFAGVEKAFAVQGGRELRVVVRPNEVDDAGARKLAQAIAQKLASDRGVPGQVKVTVIRELRAQEIVK